MDGSIGIETQETQHGCPRIILVHNVYLIEETLSPSPMKPIIHGRLRLHDMAAFPSETRAFFHSLLIHPLRKLVLETLTEIEHTR